MASTYENDLRLEEMATGENSGSWGTKTNTNLELIADAFSYGTETIANADTTITIADGAADAARSLALKINSSEDLTTTRVVTLAPNTTSKVWIIENNTSGGQTLTISAGSGTNITLENGKTKIIATDGIGAGSNVVELTQDIAIADLFVDDDLTVGDDIIMNSDGGILKIGADADLQVTHSGSAGTITNATGNLTVDVAGDIELNADGGDWLFYDGSVTLGSIQNDGSDNIIFMSNTNDKDIKFLGIDNSSTVTALLLDMSAAGAATFNAGGVFNESGADSDFRVESDNDTHMLFVDASTSRIGLITSAPEYTLDVLGQGRFRTADNSTQLTLESTDADASGGPTFTLYRNSSSPAANDFTGKVRFEGRNNNSQSFIAAEILTKIQDVADGSEDGDLRIYTMVDGTTRNRLAFYTDKTVFNDDSIDVDFRVESNNNANMLFVDAGNDKVGVGTNTLQATMHVFSGDSGASVHSNANELFVENSADAGITIGSGNTSSGSLRFADDGGTGRGIVYYDHSNDNLVLYSGGSERVRINSTETVFNDDSADTDFRVESDGNTHMLFVDASTDRVGIGAGASPASTLHVVDTTEDPYVLVDGSGATRDSGYKINAGGGVDIAIRLDAAGNMFFGPNADIKVDNANNVIINEASADVDFRVESNNNAHMLFVDAGNDRVNIGTSSSSNNQDADLNVNGFGIKSFGVNSNTLTDTGISVNQDFAGMACMVLASNHYSTGAATRAAQYFLQFYYDGNTAPAVVQVAGTTGLVTFGVSANNTLTIQMPAGGNHISFLMSG